MGRLRLAQDKVEDAIEALKESAELDPDEADVYLLLARAHARAAEWQIEPDWQAHIRHARDACRRTSDIGGKDHPDTKEAAELEEQLNRLEEEVKEGAAAAAGDGKLRADSYAGASS